MKKQSEQLGLEKVLWESANALRGTMDSSDYKHVVLGLLFLKYLFDVDSRNLLVKNKPQVGEITWRDIEQASSLENSNSKIDSLVVQIEKLNPKLIDKFPRFSSFEGLSKGSLKKLIYILKDVDLTTEMENGRDLLSRTYEYFHSQFAAAEGRLGGEFYTPKSIVRLMVSLLEPFSGKIYDPACGTGGLFIQVKSNSAQKKYDLTKVEFIGQESNPMTWRLAQLNLYMQGLNYDLGQKWGDSFSEDQHSNLLADFIMTNPPFGKGTTWPRQMLLEDSRWQYGLPPENPANFAWIQHYLSKLAPNGTAITVMPNGTLTSLGIEGGIRARLIEEDKVEAIISLPGQLFYSTPIPVSLWILAHNKSKRAKKRDRKGEILLIDAQKFGHLTSKVHRDFSDEDINLLTKTLKDWQEVGLPSYAAEFAISVGLERIIKQEYSLNPSEYLDPSRVINPGESLKSAKILLEQALAETQKLSLAISKFESDFDSGTLNSLNKVQRQKAWPEVALKDIAKIIGGSTPDTKKSDYFGGSVVWITPKDLASHKKREIIRGERSLTVSGLNSCGARLVPSGSILVSSRAPIGLVAIAGTDLATNQGIRALVMGAEQDSRYWYYVLKSATEKLNAAGNGTTFKELRGSTLGNLKFFCPPLEDQVLIANWLDTFENISTSTHELHSMTNNLIKELSPGLVSGLISIKS